MPLFEAYGLIDTVSLSSGAACALLCHAHPLLPSDARASARRRCRRLRSLQLGIPVDRVRHPLECSGKTEVPPTCELEPFICHVRDPINCGVFVALDVL